MARLRRTTAALAASGLCVAFACLGNGASSAAFADDGNLKNQQTQVQQQLQATGEDLVSANASVAAAQATLAQVAKNLPAAQAALADAQGKYAAAKAEDDALAGRLKAAQSSLLATQHEVDKAQQRLATNQGLVGTIARALYSGSDLATISAYMTAKTPTDLFDKAALISSVLHHTNDVIEATKQAKAELDQKQALLSVVTDQISSLRDQSAAALAQVQTVYAVAQAAETKVATLVAQRQNALNIAGAYLRQVQERYDELQRKSQEIQAQLAARGSTSAGPGAPGKGGLIWPANGPVTSPYGYRTDPYTGKRQLHAGVDIGAANGSDIWAAETGVVALVETPSESGGYGNYTCIDHGGGFATCYAHQSLVLVHVGESVTQGEVIGHVGSTGNSTGPHLHFETRVNGNPVDPMQYY